MNTPFEHFKGNEEFVARVLDYLKIVDERKQEVVTPFLASNQCYIIESLMGNQYYYHKDGGYDGSERNRYFISAYEEDGDCKIVKLKAKISQSFEKLSHPDVLGALMNLGIEREVIGDILVLDDIIYIICDEAIASYIIMNLKRIKHQKVNFEYYEGIINYEVKIEYKSIIIASLRLDVLVSALAHVSRSKAQMMIKSKLVKVNQVVLEEIAYMCDNGTAISIRRSGRFYLKEVVKKTKKDHYIVIVGKYC